MTRIFVLSFTQVTKITIRFFSVVIIATVFVLFAGCKKSQTITPEWPEITREVKPWTRWWWHGSSVTKEGITSELEAYKKAGLGGVEITPIYGVFGQEENFIEYLSPAWMDMLEHTLNEAERLDLGVDMATGTGWPFGGPWVSELDACKNINYKVYVLQEGESLRETVVFTQEPYVRSVGTQVYELHGIYKIEDQPTGGTIKEPLMKVDARALTINQLKEPVESNKNLQSLALDQVKFKKQLSATDVVAYSSDGQVFNITEHLTSDGRLKWVAPQGKWTIYAVFPGWHGKMVERAAPGGEGNVIDHFSSSALNNYLQKFDKAFEGRQLKSLRAFFNDSYEVDDARGTADWTPDLFEEFKKRRGYDLREHLPALFARDSAEKNERVLCDYRETIGELLYHKFTTPWREWAGKKGKIIRNQAHGSPANILDLYAEVDIPEMEGNEVLRIKMASSAANVTGKKLTSSESATWLNEHFTSSLSDIKRSIDRFLVSGVNHTFYHGTCYSPGEAGWPGWLFYASVHLNPRNSMWDDFGKLNDYIARCQSFLQQGTPANDVLLYFPIYDRYSTPGREMLEHFDGVDKQFDGTAFKHAAEWMVEKGYSFDYISDKQINNLRTETGRLRSSPVSLYKTIVVPHCRYIPLETLRNLKTLGESGATIIFFDKLPESVSGFAESEKNKIEYLELTKVFHHSDDGVNEKFLIGDDLSVLLTKAGVAREVMVDKGLQFIRKRGDHGTFYLITNWSNTEIDDWITFSVEAQSVVLFDPLFNRMGRAEFDKNNSTVRLQMQPGESIIVYAYDTDVMVEPYPYLKTSGDPIGLRGPWKLNFVDGGPALPEAAVLEDLVSWTMLGAAGRNFSGTAHYEITFPDPGIGGNGYMLDLGQVQETARVKLNGQFVNTLIGPDYKVYLDKSLIQPANVLVVEVSNLMANRIADLERRGVPWKIFYNVNFPARLAENRVHGLFSAAHWEPVESGLMGPVSLIPVKRE